MNLRHFCSAFAVIAAAAAIISCKKDDETETLPSLEGRFGISGELKEYIYYRNEDRPSEGTDDAGEKIPAGSYKIVPEGARHPQGKDHQKYIGYYYRQTPPTVKESDEDGNTVQNCTTYVYDAGKPLSQEEIDKKKVGYVTFKDSLYTCTVSFSAFAEGHYGTTATKYVTVVRGGINRKMVVNGKEQGSSIFIKGFDSKSYIKPDGYLQVGGTDKYPYIGIGGRKWMQQNLAEPVNDGAAETGQATEAGGAIPFKDCEAMAEVFGLYYTYEQAKKACPDGWHLPTEADWAALAKAVNPELEGDLTGKDIEGVAAEMIAEGYFNTDINNPDEAARMWEWYPFMEDGNGDNILNRIGFCAIPTGYANIGSGKFESSFKDGYSPVSMAMFWTESGDTDRPSYRYISNDKDALSWGSTGNKSLAMPVRCVAD